MKTNSHDSICIVESLLNTIAMMNINIKIEYPGIHFKQLKYTQNNIINITKATSLSFPGMMIAPTPINNNISNTSNNKISRINTPPSSKLTEIIQSFKPRTIKRLINFIFSFKFRIISCFFSFFFFININNIIFFRNYPFLQIIYISWIME